MPVLQSCRVFLGKKPQFPHLYPPRLLPSSEHVLSRREPGSVLSATSAAATAAFAAAIAFFAEAAAEMACSAMASTFDCVCLPFLVVVVVVVDADVVLAGGGGSTPNDAASPATHVDDVVLACAAGRNAESSSTSSGAAGVTFNLLLLLDFSVLLFVRLPPPATAARSAAADDTDGDVCTVTPPCSTSRSLVLADGMFMARSRGDKLACVAGLADIFKKIHTTGRGRGGGGGGKVAPIACSLRARSLRFNLALRE